MCKRSQLATCLLAGIFLCAWAPMAPAATSTVRVTNGLSRPVFLTAPAGDTGRLFVAEQHTGRIQILDPTTGGTIGTFLDIDGLATGGGSFQNEQGLLGLAFDPDYGTNGFFYVNINTSVDGGDTHIRRYKVQGDPATSNVADPSSEFDILTIDQPQSNHNGGWIGFGPNDDLLYIATGDGGGGNDDDFGHTSGIGNGQDITNNLLGAMLRIDPSTDASPAVPYTIPVNNPFVGVTGDDEIWAYGLRNPYRSSFDRATGDLWIGDVGQSAREEVDFQPASSTGGENYGWRLREGTIQTPGSVGGPPPPGNAEPVYDYVNGSGQRSVIGGYVYRGPVAELQGHYIFADAFTSQIWKLDPNAVSIPNSVVQINSDLTPDVGTIAFIGSFGEDDTGNLYIMEFSGGELYRIASSSQDIVWNGDTAVGIVGDGTSWGSSPNWSRAGVPDVPFVTDDNVIFAAGSSVPAINLQSDRTVAAVTFEAPYTLQNNQLQVLSGNVTVDAGVTAVIESDLEAETANHSIRKLGTGTLLVEGNAGQTVVKAGSLGGSGILDHLTVGDGGTVAPGSSPGVLHVTNSFTMKSGSTLEIEIGGTTVGTEYDRLEIGGLASLSGGTLQVSLIDLGGGIFAPGTGDQFAFLSANLGFDMFGQTLLPGLAPGLEWLLNPGGITLSLNVQIALPGDYNLNGVVDAADYTVWLDSLGDSVVDGSFADGNGDGVVNAADYSVWKSNFGAVAGSESGTSVPEPAALLLMLLGIGCITNRVLKHRKRI